MMVDIMFADPGVEQIAFMPSLAGARRFMRKVWLAAGIDEFWVAQELDTVVGFAWLTEHGGVSLVEGARASIEGWGVLGPVRLAVKGWPRQLVEIPMPAGPKLSELQTHPSRRGAGIGTRLLAHAIEVAGPRSLSLTTRTDNPARRLYERHGFVVMAQKNHRAFERRTGASGRILMVRPSTDG